MIRKSSESVRIERLDISASSSAWSKWLEVNGATKMPHRRDRADAPEMYKEIHISNKKAMRIKDSK